MCHTLIRQTSNCFLAGRKRPGSPMSFVLTAIIMFAFWMLLSGKFTFILLLSGVISSLLVAYLSHDLLLGGVDLGRATATALRFIGYLPWLFWQIIVSNLD